MTLPPIETRIARSKKYGYLRHGLGGIGDGRISALVNHWIDQGKTTANQLALCARISKATMSRIRNSRIFGEDVLKYIARWARHPSLDVHIRAACQGMLPMPEGSRPCAARELDTDGDGRVTVRDVAGFQAELQVEVADLGRLAHAGVVRGHFDIQEAARIEDEELKIHATAAAENIAAQRIAGGGRSEWR